MTTVHKPRMLIVDDDWGMRETLRRIMAAKGYDMETVMDGRQAVQIAEGFGPENVSDSHSDTGSERRSRLPKD